MNSTHGSCIADPDLLHQLVTQELKSRGIEIRLETPKPGKKSFAPFSTPSANTPYGNAALLSGRIFGRRLSDLSKLLVSLEDNQETDVLVPKLIVSACKYIEDNVEIEGLYRLSGSAARQKVMRKEIDGHGDFSSLTAPPSVLDVAALLKQFLRELPLPIVPRIYHTMLASAFLSGERLDNMLLSLLLLPSEHLASLSFLMRHLNTVARSSVVNKMTSTNLAIVLSPNLLPVQDNLTVNQGQAKVDKKTVDLNSKKLKLHTDILEWMITHSDRVGYVTTNVMERYNACMALPSYCATSHSEDNLDEDVSGPSRRKTKKKHIRRRSGSLSRVLSSMGKSIKKAMGQESPSIHSTPLPVFGATPDFPSPRGHHAKRKAATEHEMSPTNKAQKRAIESTFTPKMRSRTFSVKRFKRRKSEGKFKPVQIKEIATSNEVKFTPKAKKYVKTPVHPNNSSPEMRKIQTRSSYTPTPNISREILDCSMKTNEDISQDQDQDNFEEEYAEVKAQYEELKRDISLLEKSGPLDEVTEKFEAACAAGNLARETRETARQMARVRRRSSSQERKPRSPSLRRIGVMRRRSREREQRPAASTDSTELATDSGPACKPPLTPLNLDKPGFRSRLQRGQPNSRSVGLEKPLPSPVLETTHGGKTRIKMSFKEREKPKVRVENRTVARRADSEEKNLTHGDSLVSLKNDISDMIEKSFGSEKNEKNADDVFVTDLDDTDSRKNEMTELSNQIENISFKAKSPNSSHVEDFFVQSSPVTRSQLRRVSDCFEFARPEDPVDKTDPGTLRRQSSAFEFRSKFAAESFEPTYENLTRDVATRQSLRRRNSSVRDLVQKIETESKKRVVGGAARCVGSVSDDLREAPVRPNQPRPVPDIRVEPVSRLNIKPLRISEENDDEFPSGQHWVDASEFFKNVTQAEAPQCGRSSIVKIRKEIKGRVQDSVSKFSHGNTPIRPGGASRRLSARMGTSVTTPHVRPPPTQTKHTLTGIRTTAVPATKRLSTYANPTIASSNKVRDKSPIYVNQVKANAGKTPAEPSYQNVVVERKNSNSRDIKRVPVERSSSRGRKSRVRRNRSDAEKKERRRKEERRYLTISGFPGEAVRSPLRERQNIPANVRRSESDRTPSRYKEGDIMTRARLREVENMENINNININVVRKHSLKSDSLMSPQLEQAKFQSPRYVKRTASERATPKTAPYNRTVRNTPVLSLRDHRQMNMDLLKSVTTADTPRRSPRFSVL